MWEYPTQYDVIVIGAGHAGSEAAHASAKMGVSTLLLTMSPDTIGKMSCNPATGGTAKGHIVREIDALGGIMGKVSDRSAIQSRMLNASKGPAVQSPRAQNDKVAYQTEVKHELEQTKNLYIKQGTVESLKVENGKVLGVIVQDGIFYRAQNVIICSGTFMKGMIHMGSVNYPGGRSGDKASNLSEQLKELGFSLGRLKTGTPPRIHRRSIDFSKTEEQKGDDNVFFSFEKQEKRLPQVSCYITYTGKETQEVIEKNLSKSPLYQGLIKGIGPRYCPSIEDKIVRFSDKPRHQIFLEPEGIYTEEIYVNGISSSLPIEVQHQMIRTIEGLENAEIIRPAYAIEYDFATSYQVLPTLETKKVEGLFFAGQINATTGYEEAAAQGLIAGINAALKVQKKPPFILSRKEAYIGVLIDDLITKDHTEPYRMFTSRAEHRILLRHDTADLRLTPYGYKLGLISKERYEKVCYKKEAITKQTAFLEKTHVHDDNKYNSLAKLLCRPDISYSTLVDKYAIEDFGDDINRQIELGLKYKGYMEREEKLAQKLTELEKMKIPKAFPFEKVIGLRNEAREKLIKFTPHNLASASKITGITPADLTILMVALKTPCK